MAATFDWNPEKNRQLIEERGISFERIVSVIERGGIVDVLEYPDQERYSGHVVHVVATEQYRYLVPCTADPDGTKFLKTIIPSCKAMRENHRRPSP